MTTKRFVKLQIIIVLMFTFTLICNTFSWAIRPEVKGGAYMSDAPWTAIKLATSDYYINGNECTAVTYRAKRDENGMVVYKNGKIEYDETTPLTLDDNNTITIDKFDSDSTLYFETVIVNHSKDDEETGSKGVTTNTSLFLDIQIHNDIGESVFVGITTPVTKSANIITRDSHYELEPKMYHVKWHPILTGIEVGPNSTRVVEWAIFKGKGTNTGIIVLENIHFTNN